VFFVPGIINSNQLHWRRTLVLHAFFELLFKRRKQQLKFSNYTILTNLIFYINDAMLYLAL